MINETALICGRFLRGERRRGEGRGGEGKGRKGREGGRCVCGCVFASAMFVNAIQQC